MPVFMFMSIGGLKLLGRIVAGEGIRGAYGMDLGSFEAGFELWNVDVLVAMVLKEREFRLGRRRTSKRTIWVIVMMGWAIGSGLIEERFWYRRCCGQD